MTKLKRTCRTCIYLRPSTYTDDYYDIEENYYPEKYPCNCDKVDYDYEIDEITDCGEYEPIEDMDIIFEEN